MHLESFGGGASEKNLGHWGMLNSRILLLTSWLPWGDQVFQSCFLWGGPWHSLETTWPKGYGCNQWHKINTHPFKFILYLVTAIACWLIQRSLKTKQIDSCKAICWLLLLPLFITYCTLVWCSDWTWDFPLIIIWC